MYARTITIHNFQNLSLLYRNSRNSKANQQVAVAEFKRVGACHSEANVRPRPKTGLTVDCTTVGLGRGGDRVNVLLLLPMCHVAKLFLMLPPSGFCVI